jgi:hypothetical protein
MTSQLTMQSAFLVQAGGASIASGNNVPDKTILLGIHIYMGGVSLAFLLFRTSLIFPLDWASRIVHHFLQCTRLPLPP